ncbi:MULTISPECIES: hypothetical protein [Methylobacterium]|uniref:hypothetical protein n=1 Tax=Methylobacterium TaxID=407 RepID=UPI0011CA2F21|nr:MULTISPECIES: hypothetical protein [Methylobacterium]TXN47519.1 hypothetical protein FV233_04445 [Methylobacterium sp. WL7]
MMQMYHFDRLYSGKIQRVSRQSSPARDLWRRRGGRRHRASGQDLEISAVAERDSFPERQPLIGGANPQVAVEGSLDLSGGGRGIE